VIGVNIYTASTCKNFINGEGGELQGDRMDVLKLTML
jgi:hypothetical protein